MAIQPKLQETKPVLADNGAILGFCEVKKFRRIIGEPLKEIIIRDADKNVVATIFVYRLHSRVLCGPLAVEGKPVDSKRAVQIARAALQSKSTPEAMLTAIQDECAVPEPSKAVPQLVGLKQMMFVSGENQPHVPLSGGLRSPLSREMPHRQLPAVLPQPNPSLPPKGTTLTEQAPECPRP